MKEDGINRRTFLGLMGTGAASAFLANPAWGDDLAQWRRASSPRVYLSDQHTDARMHLGGIGTGNFEIGADGQLTTWQIFNTLRDGEVPFYFAIKAGPTAKLLQTAGGPDWPRIQRIEMTGEYPIADLRFKDDQLPVTVELSAFSPFTPLDVKVSSMPLAVFRFRIRNPTAETQEVSLAALVTNPVGYAAIGEIKNGFHPSLGGNITDTFREGAATGLYLRAQCGDDPALDRLVILYLLKDLFVTSPDNGNGGKNYAANNPADFAIPPLDRPDNLQVKLIGAGQFHDPANTVIWLEDAPADLAGSLLQSIYEAVQAGATLVFSGRSMPLLSEYAKASGGRPLPDSLGQPDIVFEDFEHGYDKWTVTGDAFGREPAHGAVGIQQPVSGFLGRGLVNSYNNSDDTTGRLTSHDFTIERNFIRFLVGGGHYATTQIRLIVGNKIVRAASGEDNERLAPVIWEARDWLGQTAHIEIVDEQKGPWGHINIDQIVFTDWPVDEAALRCLEKLLPIRFSAVSESGGFREPILYPETKHATSELNLEQFSRPLGKGRVVLFAGQLLDPAHNYSCRARQSTYSVLCSLAGASYTVTQGQSRWEPGYGTLALAFLAGEITTLTHFTDWDEAWAQFNQKGRFHSLPGSASPPGQTINSALASTVSVPPGATVEVPFLFAWHYPNKYGSAGDWMGCHYATQRPDAAAVMREAVANYQSLTQATDLFRETFYDSNLPYWVLDAMTANAAIIRHVGVVFRIANGQIYAWEGSNGSCQPTCTHVWGYEQSLSRLFPELDRSMREIDCFHQQNPNGGINNRTAVPAMPFPTGERPFTDGQASCVLKAYREALNSPDDSFLKDYWPKVKSAVEYLIARDGQSAGILQDDQWNTYDEALHGVTTFISGYYLAALRAGEEWARRVDDNNTADHFHEIFLRGQKKLIELCWNGEYFQQYLPDYAERRGEVGPGCMSDQLLGQWWAHQLNLGYILPREMVVSSLRSIFKYNWKSNLTGWKHWPRAFAGVNDKGLIVCTWPKGGRPANVLLYSDEVWTGMEYHVAAHLIYEGMIEEGFSIVKGARDRYDGIPRPPIGRNPWCEIECGGHYTRAMSSWSLLLALSGFHYDSLRHTLQFIPAYQPANFKSFFSASEAWGSLTRNGSKIEVAVKFGKLRLKTLSLGIVPKLSVQASRAGQALAQKFAVHGSICQIDFDDRDLILSAGETLEVVLT